MLCHKASIDVVVQLVWDQIDLEQSRQNNFANIMKLLNKSTRLTALKKLVILSLVLELLCSFFSVHRLLPFRSIRITLRFGTGNR